MGVFIFSFLSLLNPQMKQLKIFAIYNLRRKDRFFVDADSLCSKISRMLHFAK